MRPSFENRGHAKIWPRISVVLVMVLTIITGGAYLLWWFIDRARRINALSPSMPITVSELIVLCMLMCIYAALTFFVAGIVAPDMALAISVKVVGALSYACNSVVSMRMAGRLNLIYASPDKYGVRAGGGQHAYQHFSNALAGLLQFLYIQWKLNRLPRRN
jgi:hypothetical protein